MCIFGGEASIDGIGKGRCSLINVEVFISEDVDEVVIGDTASAEL